MLQLWSCIKPLSCSYSKNRQLSQPDSVAGSWSCPRKLQATWLSPTTQCGMKPEPRLTQPNPTQPTFVCLAPWGPCYFALCWPSLSLLSSSSCCWPSMPSLTLLWEESLIQSAAAGPGWLCLASNGSKKTAKAGWGWWNVGGHKAQKGVWGERLVDGVKAPLQLLVWMDCQAPEFWSYDLLGCCSGRNITGIHVH